MTPEMMQQLERYTTAGWVATNIHPPAKVDVLLWIPEGLSSVQIGYWEPGVLDWYVDGIGYLRHESQPEPTHWMPLPEGPA